MRNNCAYLRSLYAFFLLIAFGFIPNFAAAERGEEVWLQFLRNGSISQAIENFQASIAEDESDALAHAGLAYLLPSRGEGEQSAHYFLQALAHSSNQPYSFLFLKEAVSRTADPDEIENALSTIDALLEKHLHRSYARCPPVSSCGTVETHRKMGGSRTAYAHLQLLRASGISDLLKMPRRWTSSGFEPEGNQSERDLSGKTQKHQLAQTSVQPYNGFINLHGFIYPSQEATTYGCLYTGGNRSTAWN